METVSKSLSFVANVLLFVLLSIIFLPAFLIVTYLQEPWTKMLGDLFDY